jgi:hypothetical protein
MITSNVIHRVFHLKFNNGTGTCFAIDFDNKQYMVTAKHVIRGLKTNDTVEIYNENAWITVPVKLTGHSAVVDISVFTIDGVIGIHPLPPTKEGLVYGQDVYFLGFPYMTNIENGMNRNFPMPLVKKGIISIWYTENEQKILLVDGNNNHGFSGGPLVFTPPTGSKTDFQIAGVISGYKQARDQVFDKNGNKIEAYFNYNTGIVLCYDIQHAIDLIKANPNGLPIETTPV